MWDLEDFYKKIAFLHLKTIYSLAPKLSHIELPLLVAHVFLRRTSKVLCKCHIFRLIRHNLSLIQIPSDSKILGKIVFSSTSGVPKYLGIWVTLSMEQGHIPKTKKHWQALECVMPLPVIKVSSRSAKNTAGTFYATMDVKTQ